MLHPLDFIKQTKWHIRQELIWARNGSCTMNARMFAPSDERIYWLVKGKKHKWNQSAVKYMTVWNINSRIESMHPCAFPLSIPRRCIEAVTVGGDMVFDPYSGSGTTGVAAVQLGRKFTGIEIDPKYFAIAKQRIEQAQRENDFLEGKL